MIIAPHVFIVKIFKTRFSIDLNVFWEFSRFTIYFLLSRAKSFF